mmetsp:Transcript_17359/g.56826  ORF Transcript_17359/g.56826 Transcript_17359/m.56826 type:complete len:82 (+) Transcript_17359:3-248(+)
MNVSFLALSFFAAACTWFTYNERGGGGFGEVGGGFASKSGASHPFFSGLCSSRRHTDSFPPTLHLQTDRLARRLPRLSLVS